MTLAIDRLASQRGKFIAGPVTASLEAGDCLAVMGANGAGKTTLLETLAGFFPATSGRVVLDGSDITDRVPERRRIAYLPQDLALFPHLDVMQNVAFATRRRRGPESRDGVDALIEEFGLGPLRACYPDQLSSGQAQRVAFARAVAMRPRVLLLDEPTTALDLSGQRSFNTHMRKLLVDHGLIIIYATHTILDSLSPASHLIVLDRGKMIQAGAPGALLHEPADVRVAELLGITNLWPAEIVDETAPVIRIRIGDHELECSRRPIPRAPVFAGIGPGEVELLADAPTESVNCFRTVIRALQVSGHVALLELAGALGGLRVTAPPRQAMALEVGQSIWIRLPADRLRLIHAAPR